VAALADHIASELREMGGAAELAEEAETDTEGVSQESEIESEDDTEGVSTALVPELDSVTAGFLDFKLPRLKAPSLGRASGRLRARVFVICGSMGSAAHLAHSMSVAAPQGVEFVALERPAALGESRAGLPVMSVLFLVKSICPLHPIFFFLQLPQGERLNRLRFFRNLLSKPLRRSSGYRRMGFPFPSWPTAWERPWCLTWWIGFRSRPLSSFLRLAPVLPAGGARGCRTGRLFRRWLQADCVGSLARRSRR